MITCLFIVVGEKINEQKTDKNVGRKGSTEWEEGSMARRR